MDRENEQMELIDTGREKTCLPAFTKLLLLFFLPVLAIAQDSLPLPVQSALNYRSIPHDSLSVYVADIASGEVVVSWNDTIPRNPASVEKMLTTLVALDALGPTYTWKTDVYLQGEVADSVLAGDLALKGHGDPYLVTERFWQLLRKIRQSGIRKIDGNLLIDDSYFDVGEHDPAAFDREPLRAYNVAPNALLTNFKVVRFYFEPEQAASRVNIVLEPPLRNLDLDNRLTVATGACRGYQRGIAMSPNEDYSEITFSGRFPAGCDYYAMDRSVLDHNAFTFGLFDSLWRESGGEITGSYAKAIIGDDVEPWFSFESPPLADMITKVNKHSNNVMARQLLYTLAAEKMGEPGTEENGRKFVRTWLEQRGLDFSELKLANGAGLSRNSRMTARHLGEMLSYAYAQPYMPEYVSSLSVAGLDGTLSRRFRNGALTGMARIKTGSLDDVSAFAGYLQAKDGKRYVVATLQNHKDIHRGPGKEVQEALLRWLYDR